MKSKTLKIVLAILVVGALLISVNALFYKSYAIGGGGLVLSLALLIFIFKSKGEDIKLPFPQVVEKYKAYMEQGFKITIPQDVLVYYVEEIEDNYIAVLCIMDKEEAKMIYFPFEANKFTAEFGRGSGQILENIVDVEFWINKYDKTYRASKEIAQVMGREIADKIRKEMEFSKRNAEEEERRENE